MFTGIIDCGTSSTRFVVFNTENGNICNIASRSVEILSLGDGLYEQDPLLTIDAVHQCIQEISSTTASTFISKIGISNQRESIVAWDRTTKKPLTNIILWMDSRMLIPRSGDLAQEMWSVSGMASSFASAGRIAWIKDKLDKCTKNVVFGTLDSWILANISDHDDVITDITNAHRTGLVSLENPLQWCEELLKRFDINQEELPRIVSAGFGNLNQMFGDLQGTPIETSMGDQHAALLGYGCVREGEACCTFGTGIFLLCNQGIFKPILKVPNIIRTVAFSLNGEIQFAYEIPIMPGAVAINWLKSSGLIDSLSDVDLACESYECGGLLFVPWITEKSLYPDWKTSQTGSFHNILTSTRREQMVQAVVQSLAFTLRRALLVAQLSVKKLKVGGGLSKNKNFLQLLCDTIGIPVYTSLHFEEATARGCFFHCIGEQLETREVEILIPRVSQTLEDSFNRWNCLISDTMKT